MAFKMAPSAGRIAGKRICHVCLTRGPRAHLGRREPPPQVADNRLPPKANGMSKVEPREHVKQKNTVYVSWAKKYWV